MILFLVCDAEARDSLKFEMTLKQTWCGIYNAYKIVSHFSAWEVYWITQCDCYLSSSQTLHPPISECIFDSQVGGLTYI